MASLETIRTKMGWLISILIFVALLSFIVDFNSLSSALNSTSSKYAVGKVDGKKVQYKDFQEQVEYQTSIAEIVNGSISSDEQHQQIRNAAWQYFIDKDLFFKHAAAAGIEVGEAEIAELLGAQQEFVSLLHQKDADQSGNLAKYLQYVQNASYAQQIYAKYYNLFAESSFCNDLTLNNLVAGNNVTYDAVVVSVPYGYAMDSTINVSSAEIKKYYNSHKDMFKQVANRDIEYALFEVTPSEEDQAAANKALEDVYDEFASASNIKNFLQRNSETSLSNYWYKAGELNTINREINDFVFSGKSGVSPIFNSGNDYYAVKVVDTKALPDSVYVRHILIQNDNALADSLMTELKTKKSEFSQLAALYSADNNQNVATPGDLGWMTQTYMLPGFESVITAALNTPYFIDTQYGRHIVEVTKKTAPIQKKQVAILHKKALPSNATRNAIYSKANTLATAAAGSLEKLQAAAKEQGVYLRPMNINEATSRYSAVDKSKEVTRWAFDAKKGQASAVITVNQNYLFVVGVKDVHKEGYASIEEAKDRINNILYQQKKADKVLAEVTEKIASCTTIEAVAEALDTQTNTYENVGFASRQRMEPALVGAIAGAEKGKLSAPVKGIMGVYVVYVTDRQEGSFYTAEDAKSFAAQKAQYTTQLIIPALVDMTETVDNRERFF